MRQLFDFCLMSMMRIIFLLIVFVTQFGLSAGCGNSKVSVNGGVLVTGTGHFVAASVAPAAPMEPALPAKALSSPGFEAPPSPFPLGAQVVGLRRARPSVPEQGLGSRPEYCWENGELLIVDDSPRGRYSRFVLMFYVHLKVVFAGDDGRTAGLVEIQEHLTDYFSRCSDEGGREPSFEGIDRSAIVSLQTLVTRIQAADIEGLLSKGSKDRGRFWALLTQRQSEASEYFCLHSLV